MEETIGLGFNSHRDGIAGAPMAFVSASVSDLKKDGNNNNINLAREKNTNNYSSAIIPHNEVISSTSSQSANIMHMQQHNQQHWQNQVQQPPMMPPPLHNVQPTFPPPTSTSSTLPEISSHSFPPLTNPPIPNNPSSIFTTQQYPLPSFEPPPGMPPVAVSSFPHPPIINVAPPISSIPPHASILHSLPPHPGAPFMPAQIPSQHLQQQKEQKPQQQQSQPQSINPIEKALAIAMRFHQEKETIIDTSIDPTINYAQKRLEHFQKEHRKLQAFQLKNLEYVMKHEEAALRRHVDCMNQMTAYEERQQLQLQLQQQQQQHIKLQLEQKLQRKDQLYGEGGIGSKEQRRAERTRVKQRQTLEHEADGDGGGGGSSNNNTTFSNNKKALRTSLYLSNLPIDGSTTERTLQSLFCSYGRLDRVTMYRCRSTGEWKGDGLIVFGRDAVGEYQMENGDGAGVDLVEAVCTQMNGAELPCGTAIGVQPADTNYKKKKPKNGEETTHQQPTGMNGTPNSVELANSVPSDGATKLTSTTAAVVNMATMSGGPEEKNVKEDDDDDLDDFFASLE